MSVKPSRDAGWDAILPFLLTAVLVGAVWWCHFHFGQPPLWLTIVATVVIPLVVFLDLDPTILTFL